MNRPPIRCFILDASASRRARHVRLLEGDGRLSVVGAAGGIDQSLQLLARLDPQVLLLGQGPHAIGWVRQIMHTRPLPIVVTSAQVDPGLNFELMGAGALAVLAEAGPGNDEPDSQMGLAQTLCAMAEVKVVRRWAHAGALTPAAARAAPPVHLPRRGIELVAIGASTGGPLVLKDVLCGLPADVAVPVVVVQHMAAGFVQGLAQWLNASCAVRTEIAAHGVAAQPGRVYLAPDGHHLRLGPNHTLLLDAGEPVNGHRPAVSCLFASVAQRMGRRAAGVLLTGMGKDGAAELKEMKDAGAITIAQDRASSVVHGMPGEAIRLGAATYVMSPREIAATLPALVNR